MAKKEESTEEVDEAELEETPLEAFDSGWPMVIALSSVIMAAGIFLTAGYDTNAAMQDQPLAWLISRPLLAIGLALGIWSGIKLWQNGDERWNDRWPVVGIFAIVLVIVGIGAQIDYRANNFTLLLGFFARRPIAIIGLIGLIVGIRGWTGHGHGLIPLEGHQFKLDKSEHVLGGLSSLKFGWWLFLVSEVFFFIGIIGGSWAVRTQNSNWAEPGEVLNVPLTALNTFILICSSVTMVEALRGAHQGSQNRMKFFLVATVFLGAVFLSIQIFEYTELALHEGLTPTTAPDDVDTAYGATFYIQTGFHGAHVLGGVIALSIITVKALKGHFEKDQLPIEVVGLYWHFVDLVWIFLFTVVYLL